MPDTSAPTVFANTVLVSWEAGQVPTLQTIGVPDQPRKKRAHCKSRRGCLACKRRRVKCDERLPCSSCVKRNIQCVQPLHQYDVSPGLSATSARFEIDPNPQISLLHLELFNHWDKETRSTLTFPQVWPVVTQRAFHEDFIMSAILSVAGMHLATLCPQSSKYSHAAMQLMAKAIRLFRQNLSRPFTKDHCEALMGTALLINYMSWVDLGFLDGGTTSGSDSLNLVQDQLFLLSSGILQVWFQAMPIFIDEGSVFTQIVYENPRLDIEDALVKIGEDPARFVKPFMTIWDDPHYQTLSCKSTETVHSGATFYAWRLLLGIQSELTCRNSLPPASASTAQGHGEKQKLRSLRDTVTRITTKYISASHPVTSVAPSSQSDRSAFERVIRCMSPLLCCASLNSTADSAAHASTKALEANIEQLFYGFPILCCGPFARLITTGDSRALVFLFHFYHAARRLLAPKRCWWASVRSSVMEELILKELDCRGLDVSLHIE
ncbi:uncharacterized protein G6M90_00g000490 [Metarhizium brunneum]|uniref:Zn(2)-C6 fungal-type domain-containing protein n=1 Tax=Metarhizium brunneum TaxID=500148 RepID=A0A7D5URA5_9HYPO